jgi:hypothetical protein
MLYIIIMHFLIGLKKVTTYKKLESKKNSFSNFYGQSSNFQKILIKTFSAYTPIFLLLFNPYLFHNWEKDLLEISKIFIIISYLIELHLFWKISTL